jgi:tripartite-type tricarboxylate transporter receptor subunit TctC
MLGKADILQVPYKGAESAMLALLGGQVQMVVIGPPAAAPQIKAGRLRALAVLGRERLADFPDLQTAAESGMPGFEVDTWYGVLAPAGVPREIVVRLNAELTRMMQGTEMRERLAAMGVQPLSSTPERFAEFFKAEVAKWAVVVKESGARAD